jgi:6-phosphogluconolactonase
LSVQLEVVELGSTDELGREAARRFVEMGHEAISGRGEFFVALSGGGTPRAMYTQLAAPPLRDYLDWSKVELFFSDERFVPPDSDQSNYHTAREDLFAHVPIPENNVHPYATVDVSAEAAAVRYEEEIRHTLSAVNSSPPVFDLVLLGMGPDGHTASLFPDTEALTIKDRLVAANFVPKMDTWRLTFTYPLINAARTVMFMVQGDDKKERVREVLVPGSSLPAAGVQPSEGRLVWLLDAAASAEFDADVSGIEITIPDPSP